MKIQSPIQEQYIKNSLSSGTHRNNKVENSRDLFREMMEEKEVEETMIQDSADVNKVLSSGEITTLHALFGSEKPEEFSMYGRNKIQNIHKGQLLDITG